MTRNQCVSLAVQDQICRRENASVDPASRTRSSRHPHDDEEDDRRRARSPRSWTATHALILTVVDSARRSSGGRLGAIPHSNMCLRRRCRKLRVDGPSRIGAVRHRCCSRQICHRRRRIHESLDDNNGDGVAERRTRHCRCGCVPFLYDKNSVVVGDTTTWTCHPAITR